VSLFGDLPVQVAPLPSATRVWTVRPGAVRGKSAVMAGRVEPHESLDFFPTPPWVGRALVGELLPAIGAWDQGRPAICLEPAIGAGHLAAGLIDGGWSVCGGDVADYGAAARLSGAGLTLAGAETRGSFVAGAHGPACPVPEHVDWVVTNPPFIASLAFARRALEIARHGVALFTRIAWLETEERWLLRQHFPLWCGVTFAERIGLLRGRFEPGAESATAYAWMIWKRGPDGNWIKPSILEGSFCMPPGRADHWSRPVDGAFVGSFEVLP
jgi:hypothetical protein